MLDTLVAYAAYARKFLIYVATVAGQLVTLGLVPADLVPYVAGAIAVLGGLGIYAADNADKPGAHAAR